MADSVSVQVALRIRPLIETEVLRGCHPILESVSNEQVVVKGADKAFTFNYVFDHNVSQEEFYQCAIKNVVQRIFKGYNVTILAYGQTGSGKTHSMGTNYSNESEKGVIPRAVSDIFYKINHDNENDYKVTVSFMELYQEVLYDLLADRPRDQCVVDIREVGKGILIPNLTEQNVFCADEALKCLIKGSLGRVTGATAMNMQSSRSHAIFTVSVHQQKKNDETSAISAKFHLVDLAGSERSKKTKATGDRFKEGVNINKGLFALGNVISALGEENQKSTGFISYRDSKLTRLLQDSLGGNSITLMVACVSPADYNMDETLSTLRYADRARKIKNKPIVNQDPKMAEIVRLNKLIKDLQIQLLERGTGVLSSNECENLRRENEELRSKNRKLTDQLQNTINDYTSLFEKALIAENAKDRLQQQLEELEMQSNITLQQMNLTNEQVAIYKQVQNKIEDIKDHTRQVDVEIFKCDSESSLKIEENNDKIIDSDSQINFDKQQETHTMQQLAFSTQLQELTRALAIKEHLASQMATNMNDLVDSNAIKECENKIAMLEHEKDELLQQLKNAQNTTNSSKLAEQRRKRVQELTLQISELNKRVTEQARLIKLKEKDELKIKQLNIEIQNMKQAKVKLVKLMKSEADNHRRWKMERERELSKLRDQDRKQRNQMIIMENKYAKQQTVLKRKVEEAAAINKRLRDALALQKATQERRGQNHGKTERIQQWVAQELEVLVSTVEAQRTLEHLVEDRALLAAQRKALNSVKASSDVENKKKELDEELNLRSVQITDLNQKIIDSDQENKSKTRWDMVQSMVEAKCALKYLFEVAADIKHNAIKAESKLDELKVIHREEMDELTSRLNEVDKKLAETNLQYDKMITELTQNHEEKISVLLNQLRNNGGEGYTACCEHMDQIKQLHNELEFYKKSNEELKELAKGLNTVTAAKTSKKSENNDSKNIFGKENKIKLHNETVTYDDFIEDCDTTAIEDDDTNDPDWIGVTPIHRKLRKVKPSVINKSSDDNEQDQTTAVKRSSNGQIKCNCKGQCSTKQCGCRKMSVQCTNKCKCSDSCQNIPSFINKDSFEETKTIDNSGNQENEDTLKRQRRTFFVQLHDTINLTTPRKKYFDSNI